MKNNIEESAIVLDIQRSSQHDGPGLRTTVFLKGCILRCAWCHNPESQTFEPQLMYNNEKCMHCGRCATVCPKAAHQWDKQNHTLCFALCKSCGMCINVCSAGALSIYGTTRTANEVFQIVRRDKIFYEHTGGGVTLSGGEPFLQERFCHALMAKCQKENIHICVETSGHASVGAFRNLTPFTDLFLFDYKTTGITESLKWTGADGRLVASNLQYVLQHQKRVILRCPIIPKVNDNNEHFDTIVRLVTKNPSIIKAELLPYHNFGVIKRKNIGANPSNVFNVPNEEEKQQWITYMKRQLGEKVCWG